MAPLIAFNVTLDKDEGEIWVVKCPSIPGCISQGQTWSEALANIQDEITTCLEMRVELGLPLAVETQEN